MELTSFVLGMLVIAAVTIVTATVLGMLRINTLAKQVREVNTRLEREMENLYQKLQREHEETWRQFEATGRDVSMVERTIMNRIDQEVNSIHLHEDELDRAIGNTHSYVDSRIDKALNEFHKEVDRIVLSGSAKSGKKNLING